MSNKPNTKIATVLEELWRSEKITVYEAIAIERCLIYSDQIADVSLGNMYRSDIRNLLREV